MLGILVALSVNVPGEIDKYFPREGPDESIIHDAISRWSAPQKDSEKAMDGRVPIVIYFQKERCVTLYLLPPNIGGNPIYCYAVNSDKLLRKFDKVE